METLAEETEDGAAASVDAPAAVADKEPGKPEGGNFRVNMNVIVRVRPLQVRFTDISLSLSLSLSLSVSLSFSLSKYV